MQCLGNTIRQLHTELQLFSNSHNLKQYLKRELCSIKMVPKNRWGFPTLLNRHHVFSFKGKQTQARGEREGRESRSFSRSLSRVNMFSCLPYVYVRLTNLYIPKPATQIKFCFKSTPTFQNDIISFKALRKLEYKIGVF